MSEKIQTANEKYTNALNEQYEHLAKAQAAYDKTETVQTILDNKIDAIKNKEIFCKKRFFKGKSKYRANILGLDCLSKN